MCQRRYNWDMFHERHVNRGGMKETTWSKRFWCSETAGPTICWAGHVEPGQSSVCVCKCAHVWSICLYVRILNRTTGQETGSAFTYSEYRKCWQPPVCVFIKGFIRFSVDICWIFSSVAASMPTSVSRSRLKYLSSFWRCALKSYTNNHKKENLIWIAWKIWPNIFIFFSRFEQDVKNDWTQVNISKSRKGQKNINRTYCRSRIKVVYVLHKLHIIILFSCPFFLFECETFSRCWRWHLRGGGSADKVADISLWARCASEPVKLPPPAGALTS